MNTILVLGGMDDTHSEICDFFTNYVYELKVMRFNENDEFYVSTPKSAMSNGRGCFGICHAEGFVYVFGGVVGRQFNYFDKKALVRDEDVDHESRDYRVKKEDGLSSQCEKYDVKADQWYQIAEMPEVKKNPGACAMNADVVYVFGGKTCHGGELVLSDTILQYIVAANIWLELPLRMPRCSSLTTTIKVNNF